MHTRMQLAEEAEAFLVKFYAKKAREINVSTIFRGVRAEATLLTRALGESPPLPLRATGAVSLDNLKKVIDDARVTWVDRNPAPRGELPEVHTPLDGFLTRKGAPEARLNLAESAMRHRLATLAELLGSTREVTNLLLWNEVDGRGQHKARIGGRDWKGYWMRVSSRRSAFLHETLVAEWAAKKWGEDTISGGKIWSPLQSKDLVEMLALRLVLGVEHEAMDVPGLSDIDSNEKRIASLTQRFAVRFEEEGGFDTWREEIGIETGVDRLTRPTGNGCDKIGFRIMSPTVIPLKDGKSIYYGPTIERWKVEKGVYRLGTLVQEKVGRDGFPILTEQEEKFFMWKKHIKDLEGNTLLIKRRNAEEMEFGEKYDIIKHHPLLSQKIKEWGVHCLLEGVFVRPLVLEIKERELDFNFNFVQHLITSSEPTHHADGHTMLGDECQSVRWDARRLYARIQNGLVEAKVSLSEARKRGTEAEVERLEQGVKKLLEQSTRLHREARKRRPHKRILHAWIPMPPILKKCDCFHCLGESTYRDMKWCIATPGKGWALHITATGSRSNMDWVLGMYGGEEPEVVRTQRDKVPSYLDNSTVFEARE